MNTETVAVIIILSIHYIILAIVFFINLIIKVRQEIND